MDDQFLDEIKDKLVEIDKLSIEHWMNTISERTKEEIEFHDRHRDRSKMAEINQDTYEKFYGNKKYYSATKSSKEYLSKWILQEARGRIFLDYCCGDGKNAVMAAKAGASLAIGIDISAVSIENAICDAQKEGVSDKTYFLQADAENTMLPSGCIERLICSGVLHHLDLSNAFPELHRILAPGGKLLAIEALDYNPVIRLYRQLTPQMRTDWEKSHILRLKDIRDAKKLFKLGEIRYWHLFGILEPHLPFLGKSLHAIDSIMTRIPFLQLMSWMFTFELIKSEH